MRPSTFRRAAVAALAVALAAGAMSPALAKPGKRQGPKPKKVKIKTIREVVRAIPEPDRCVGDPAAIQRLEMTINGQPTWGLVARPSSPPKGIVVFAHGYGHTPDSWRTHLTRTADQLKVVAIGMNYRDTWGGTLPETRGWEAAEGADDSVQIAQEYERGCPTAKTIVMYGVSMGGNIAGLAVATKAKRRDTTTPLFDYLFDIEGAMNVTETYFEARALAGSGNQFAKDAVADIEREMGGPFESRSDTYLERTVVNRAADIKASGVKGIVMVHGVDDGLVGYNQSPEFYTRMRALGVPVDFWTAVTKGKDSEAGTTLDGYVPVPHDSPFAGHASEASSTHIVGMAGFERLAALFLRREAPACRVGILDGETGHTQTNPVTQSTPCLTW